MILNQFKHPLTLASGTAQEPKECVVLLDSLDIPDGEVPEFESSKGDRRGIRWLCWEEAVKVPLTVHHNPKLIGELWAVGTS